MFPSLFHYRFPQHRLVGVNGWGICIALGWMVCTSGAQAEDSPTQRLFTKHCQKCHSGEKPKGKFDITKLSPDFADKKMRERWQAVIDQIESGDMPPKEKPRPPKTEVNA